MKRVLIVVGVCCLVVLFSPALFRKRTVPLFSSGKIVAIAKRPPITWRDKPVPVYAGKTKLFSLWGGFFEFPLFVHPFPDGTRFLCVYDDDTAVLVFVVDLHGALGKSSEPGWPPNGYLRDYLARAATNIVIEKTVPVRLPSYAEVQEVSDSLKNLAPSRFRAMSFPCADFGIYRGYWPKAALLNALHTNRQSVWP